MNLNDLKTLIELYDGDIERMEMDKQMEKLKGLSDAMFDPREELRKLAEAGEEKEQNPLASYSTTELKKELRRRKGKLK